MNESTKVIDFREAAPAAAKEDMFYPLYLTEVDGVEILSATKQVNVTGGLSIAVPGELRGLHTAHK